MSEIKSSGESAGRSISSNFGGKLAAVATVAKTAASAALAVGTAVVSAGSAFYDQAKKVAEFGDNIDKASQRLGVSSQFYQEWDAVLQHSGTSIDSMTAAFKTLSNAANGATADQSAAFEKLGMSLDEVAKMSSEDLFTNVVKQLGQMEEGTERTALAQDLLGRSAMELGPLLNSIGDDPESLDRMIEQFDKLGLMTEEDVAASARFADSLQDMQTAFDGIANSLTADFLPGIADVMDGITDIFAGDYTQGQDAIKSGVESMLQAAQEDIPIFLEVGAEIIGAVVEGVINAIPSLVEGAAEIYNSLYETAVELAPDMEEAGYKFIEYLADGMPGAFSLVCSMINNLGAAIFTVLASFISGMLKKGAEMVSNLGSGISGAIGSAISAITGVGQSILNSIQTVVSDMLSKGSQMISNLASGVSGALSVIAGAISTIVNAIKNPFSRIDLSAIGANIIQGLYNGIKSKFDAVIGSITGFANAIGNAFKTATQQASPSKLWRKYGRYLIEGLELGIKDRTKNAVAAVENIADEINSSIKTSISDIQAEIDAITAEQDRRSAEKELKDREERLDELYKKLAESTGDDIAKYQKEIDDLKAEYAEKDLRAQENAQIKELQSARDHLEDLQDAYQDAMDEIADTYDDTMSDIQQSQDRLTDKMMGYGDLFTWETKRSGKSMSLGNLDYDIQNLQKYSDTLNALKDMGVPSSLMAEILDMGVDDAIAYGSKLLNMGAATFQSYIGKWNERESLANSIASGWYAGDKASAEAVRAASESRVNTEYADDLGLSIGTQVSQVLSVQVQELMRALTTERVILQIDGQSIGSALLNPISSAMRQRGVVSLA